MVSGQGQKVNVEVSGKRYVISQLKDSDIIVTASLATVNAAGEFELKLTAVHSGGAADYTITKITPDKIKVRFDRIAKGTYDVGAEAIGVKAETGFIAEAPTITNTNSSKIIIEGPQSDIDNIAYVVSVAQVNKTLAQTESFAGKIELRDINGEVIDPTPFTLQYTEAEITVQISKSKTVPIVASFANQPGVFLTTSIKHTLSVSSVKVIGPPEVIDPLTEITLPPIDFNEIDLAKKTFTFDLVLPVGARSNDDIKKVTVTLNLSGYSKKTLTVTKFVPVNMGAKKVIANTESKTVTMVGPSSVLRTLKSSNVYLQYDMNQVTGAAGQYQVNAILKAYGRSDIWGAGTYQIQITVQ